MLSIGKLAALTTCKTVTIRYYEQVGLLPEPDRRASGHRVYGDSHLARLRFIRKARELGFPLSAIRDLLALSERSGQTPCEEVDRIAGERLAEVRVKLSDLKALEQTLEGLLDECRHTTLRECRILDAFQTKLPGQTDTPPR